MSHKKQEDSSTDILLLFVLLIYLFNKQEYFQIMSLSDYIPKIIFDCVPESRK